MANPALLSVPLCRDAEKNTIPVTDNGTTGKFSEQYGWQGINSLPLSAGGKAVERLDFNGVLALLGGIDYMTQRGYTFEYDNTLPYVAGCIVVDPLDGKTYRCINDVPIGASNPSNDPINWIPYDIADYVGGALRSKAYNVGDTSTLVGIPAGYFLECTTAGTTATTAPTVTQPVSAGTTISDGTVVWTVRKCFPTSGGILIAPYIVRDNNNSFLMLCGGTDIESGGTLDLRSKDNDGSDHAGGFVLRATGGADGNTWDLKGKTNGDLTWKGRQVFTSDAINMVGTQLYRNADNSTLNIIGGTSSTYSPYLTLFGKDAGNGNGGKFTLIAQDGNNSIGLDGRPDGTLLWGTAKVLTDADGGYFPLSGGALIAPYIRRNVDNSFLMLYGGTEIDAGATLDLRGKDNDGSDHAGGFVLRATDGNGNTWDLKGKTNGDLLWKGRQVFTSDAINMVGTQLYRNADDSTLNIIGGTSSTYSPYLTLFGKNAGNGNGGKFTLIAQDGNNSIGLDGRPDGTLLWGNNDLAKASIVASSIGQNGYYKNNDGMIIAWSNATGKTYSATTPNTVTFPITFTSAPRVIVSVNSADGATAYVTNVTNTGFSLWSSVNNTSVYYIAIGK